MNQDALERFYAALEKVKDRDWRVCEDASIRSGDRATCACPLEAAACETSFTVAGSTFGFTKAETLEVAYAADNAGLMYGERRAIRARMLAILQLEEPK